ncbi:MAG TPA: VOC family protein [Gemmatimonadaceae bacterium]|nr:VOC family protein [Gemmatimonadaceae bacterium]
MDKLYARSVFFVDDAERSLRFYQEQLGFAMDWNYQEAGRAFVCQVSLFGFELILNQIYGQTRTRAGHGRVFIGLDDDQGEPLRQHIVATGIPTQRVDWGRPTLVIKDLDANEIFFWLPHDDFSGFATSAIEASRVVEPMK